MYRRVFLVVIALLMCSLTYGNVMDSWLVSESIDVNKPAFYNVNGVDNKIYSGKELFKESGIDIDQLSPRLDSDIVEWQRAEVTDGKISIEGGVVYLATYVTVDNWCKATIDLEMDCYSELFVDGKSLHFNSYDSGVGSTSKKVDLELEQGTHQVVIKCMSESSGSLGVKIEVKEKFDYIKLSCSESPLRAISFYDNLNGTRAEGASISPLGNYIIYRESSSRGGEKSRVCDILDIDSREVVYSFRGSSAFNIEWKPKTDIVTWLQKEGSSYSLYSYNIESRKLECLISRSTKLKNFRWSPSADYILYQQREDYSDKSWSLRRVDGMEDRQSYYQNRSFIFKYDLTTRVHSRVTWGNLSTSIMDISKDGEQIIVSTSTPDYNNYPFEVQNVSIINLKDSSLESVWSDRLQRVNALFSPDGRKLLLSGSASSFGEEGENIERGQTVNGYDSQLFIYDIESREVEYITKEFNPSVSHAEWLESGDIIFGAEDGEYNRLYRYRPESGIEQVNIDADIVNSFSLSSSSDRGFILASKVQAPNSLYSIDLKSLDVELWSSPSADDFKDITFGDVVDWDYSYDKRTTLKGRYYLPANFDKSKKYPLIVYYYGGTSPVGRNFGGRYPFNVFTSKGYVIYIMQPSGSTGFGQEFSARHQNNWGIVTGDEIIESSKAFIEEHPFVDGSRVGCMGASYGGFTTQYLLTQTDMFACAISHAGISSLSSYWGEGYWGYSYSTNATAGSYPWNRKDIYVDQSPLFNADKVTTPLLLIHGTKDVNVPTGESIQMYTALKLLKQDVELVLVKDADHHVLEYKQVISWHNSITAYFDKYLKGRAEWWNNLYPDRNL